MYFTWKKTPYLPFPAPTYRNDPGNKAQWTTSFQTLQKETARHFFQNLQIQLNAQNNFEPNVIMPKLPQSGKPNESPYRLTDIFVIPSLNKKPPFAKFLETKIIGDKRFLNFKITGLF